MVTLGYGMRVPGAEVIVDHATDVLRQLVVLSRARFDPLSKTFKVSEAVDLCK